LNCQSGAMIHKIAISASWMLIFSGCVSGPKDDRTFAEKMNGENYESTNVVLGVPVLERKPIQRTISGHIYCGERFIKTPLAHASVELFRKHQQVSTVLTDSDGHYNLNAEIDPSGSYRLEISGTCGAESRPLSDEDIRRASDFDFYLKHN
jgi:hypothetical protein